MNSLSFKTLELAASASLALYLDLLLLNAIDSSTQTITWDLRGFLCSFVPGYKTWKACVGLCFHTVRYYATVSPLIKLEMNKKQLSYNW